MTTLLPTNELAFYRAIARTAAVLLVCLRIDELYPGRAIADFEIADILEQDPRTVNKQLRSLSAAGLVLEQRENKYVVTPQGRNTLFANRQTTYLSIEETKKISETSDFCTQCVPHDMNDDAKNVLIDSSSSIIIERTNCAKILEETHLLFKSPVCTTGIIDRDPTIALAWISKAYSDQTKLTNPAGLVYARLRDNVRPPVSLLKNPARGLPAEYLSAIGYQPEAPEPVVSADLSTLDKKLQALRDRQSSGDEDGE